MKKTKKIVSSLALGIALVGATCVSASAWENYVSADGGMWRYGLAGSDPYYMGYSYYHHNTRVHGSSASLAGRISRSVLKAPGYTSCANTESLQSTDVKAWYRFE